VRAEVSSRSDCAGKVHLLVEVDPQFGKFGIHRLIKRIKGVTSHDLRKKHLSRCEKGSKNREKARVKVARIYQRVSDMRTDFLQKLSTQLVHENQVILVETLGTKNLLKNGRLARAIADAGFGDFLRMLGYKCTRCGRTLVKVDRFFPSSKLCCICHQKNAELKLQERFPRL
jgi:putative transposase